MPVLRSTSGGPGSSRRLRAPMRGGRGTARHLDLVLLGGLAASALAATAILVARGLAAAF